MDGGANFGGGVPSQPSHPTGIPWEQAVIRDRPGWLARLLGARDREDRGYRMKWGEWTWRWGIWCDLCNFGDDNDWSLHIGVIYGAAFIKLPFLPNREPKDNLDQWGFSWSWSDRGESIHFHWGTHTKIVHLPWAWGSCVRSEIFCADGVWRKDIRYSRLGAELLPLAIRDLSIPATETHPYRYICRDGKIQDAKATISVGEMEWRWAVSRKLRLPWPRKVCRSIDVTFTSDEKDFDGIGERAGSWKGGTIGCGYTMKPDEMPIDTLRRMQRERRFS